MKVLALYDIHANIDALEVVLADPAPAQDDMAARTSAITAIEIGVDQARGLGELPLTIELDGVLYCHASPRRDDEILTRLSPAERYADALSGIADAVVVAGHTHQQDDRSVGSVRFISAGSVGLPYEGDGSRAGCGSPTASPGCATLPTTPPPPANGCSLRTGQTRSRSGPRSGSPSSRSSSPGSSKSAPASGATS